MRRASIPFPFRSCLDVAALVRSPNRQKGKGKDEQLLSLFQRAERRGLSLKRQSYTWAVVAYKRCGRTKEAVDAAESFSKRGIVVS